jgi:hypothetical protein
LGAHLDLRLRRLDFVLLHNAYISPASPVYLPYISACAALISFSFITPTCRTIASRS